MQTGNDELKKTYTITFYRICGIATLIMMSFFVFDIIIWALLGPYPNTSEGWFTLLNQDRISGVLLLSLPTFFGTILYCLTFFGLYYILKKIKELKCK